MIRNILLFNIMTLIAVEGPSFSGKSTLLAQLAAQFSTETIGEHHDYVSNGFPPNPKTNEAAYVNADFFFSLEKKRAADTRQALGRHAIVFSDRSVASLVAYQLALAAVKDRVPGAIPVPEYVTTLARQEIEAGNIEIPNGFILLRVADETTHNLRVDERGRTNSDIFNQYYFSQAISDATEEACRLICPTVPIHTIMSKNFEGGREYVLNEAVRFIEEVTLPAL
jgi:thymidylate kinase